MIRLIFLPIFMCIIIGCTHAQMEQLSMSEKTAKVARTYVKFTLRNDSDKTIPLIIPTVMNPNLSPNSDSAVTLKIGQEVLFKAKGKKRILLVVDETIEEGAVLEVSQLLAERKKELGIK